MCSCPESTRKRLLVRMHSSSCFFYYFLYLVATQSQGLVRVTKTGGLGFSGGQWVYFGHSKESIDIQGLCGGLAVAVLAVLNFSVQEERQE